MKYELLKLLKEYQKDLKEENRRISETAWRYSRNMSQRKMSFDSFVEWLETGRIVNL